MGRRYYCDYCDRTMSSAPSIIRTHNNGLLHQKAKLEHFQKFKDPETILAEEIQKKPCSRFPLGQCQFGSICRFSHYSAEAIQYLRNYVETKKLANAVVAQPCFQDLYNKLQSGKSTSSAEGYTTLVDNSGVTHTLPWTNNLGDNIPPSVMPVRVQDFENVNISEWG